MATTGTNPGQVNNAADARALFLKVFGGEVLTEFLETNVMMDAHMQRRISSGKSAQFPALGRTTADFHARGTDIFADAAGPNPLSPRNALNHVEKVIEIDDLLVAATILNDLDELINHYDLRGPYKQELGQALATTYDQFALQQVTRAARTNSVNDADFIPADLGTQGDGGYVQVAAPDATTLVDGLKAAAVILDEKEVPRPRRFAPLSPAHYWLLINTANENLFDRELGNAFNGVYAKGEIMMAAGFELLMTNHIPSTNVATNPTGANNDYSGDFTALVTTVFHESAIGTVLRLDPTLESEYMIQYQGWPMVAKMAAGIGRLRPNAAVEIGTGVSQPAL